MHLALYEARIANATQATLKSTGDFQEHEDSFRGRRGATVAQSRSVPGHVTGSVVPPGAYNSPLVSSVSTIVGFVMLLVLCEGSNDRAVLGRGAVVVIIPLNDESWSTGTSRKWLEAISRRS